MNRYIYIFLVSMIAIAEADAQNQKTLTTSDNGCPRLVVNISIDQLRTDYIQKFMPYYGTEGFKKLLQAGTIYENASVSFLPVDRTSASASLVTGTTPFYDGIPSAEWFARKSRRKIQCTTDLLSLQTPSEENASPANILSSTIGDELKIYTNNLGKVYSIASRCDAAIMLAGHAADGAFWINTNDGLWTTSTYFGNSHPRWMTSFNKQNSFQSKSKTFSIPLVGDTRFADYITSPYINNDITAMALQCAVSNNLGGDLTPDILNVQYYAGTFKNKSEYESCTELQNTYVQLDAALSTLVKSLENRVGEKNILFVISSTGYFNEPVTDYGQYKVPSGKVYVNRTANLLNMYLSAIYGQAHYVDEYVDNNIYLNHKIIEQKHLKLNEVLERSREMLIMSDGISNAYTSFDLSSYNGSINPLMHNGFNLDACGDLVIETAPGWKLINEETQKQQQWRQYGFAFPIIIYGADVKHDVVNTPVTIDQIAPTICHSIHIRAPNACKSAPLH